MAQKNILLDKKSNFFVIFEDAASSVLTVPLRPSRSLHLCVKLLAFLALLLAFSLCVFALSFLLFLLFAFYCLLTPVYCFLLVPRYSDLGTFLHHHQIIPMNHLIAVAVAEDFRDSR
jgi:hypothetical protein